MTDASELTVFVTGATSGFGEATARRFSAAGSKLILAGRRRERLDSIAEELGQTAHVVPLDVRDRRAVQAAVGSLPSGFADIDVLVNSAGLALGLEPAHRSDLDDWDAMIDTNIKGLLYCTRAVLPGMVQRDRGHVINLGSVAATYPYPGGNAYAGTKAFVRQFSLNLRADLLGTSIRVSDVAPGLAETEFSIVRFKGDRERAKTMYAGTEPLSAADIADVVFWVATRPRHVNVNEVEIMPTCQAFGPLKIHRREGS